MLSDAFTALLACGLEPNEKTTLFIQSDNPYHCELSWILENNVNINRLMRMHQFKDKAARAAKNGRKEDAFASTLGLLSYPVLMTADIMLYNATHVPVGDDQLQHVEIARDIINRFNQRYNVNFNLPQAEICEGSRIMSLADGTKKMSKSAQTQYSNITIIDSPERIQQCIKRAKTDSLSGFSLDREKRPEIVNLLTLMAAATGESVQKVYDTYKDSTMSVFKPALADALIACLAPIRKRYMELQDDPSYVREIMQQGAEETMEEAAENMKLIKTVMGLLGCSVCLTLRIEKEGGVVEERKRKEEGEKA